MSKKNILTPVDFSVNSIQAFDFAVQYSRQNNAILHLLHVIDPSFNEKNHSQNDDFIMLERLRNANEELKKFVNEIPHPGVEIIENLRVGKPSQQVLIYSRTQQIDLIIISSHGWTYKKDLPTGSVASKIIELSKIPVICLRTSSSVLKKYEILYNNTMAENWVG
jgi:nucleotide-binding universal stress UspA family protein